MSAARAKATSALTDGEQPGQANHAAWGEFLASNRDRLRTMVVLRLGACVRGRIDPLDVIQESFLEATERKADYDREIEPTGGV